MSEKQNVITEERRKYKRIEKECIVNFGEFSASGLGIAGADAKIESITKDLSAGGILFASKRSYEIGSILKFELAIPGWEKFKAEFIKPDSVTRSKPLVAVVSVVRVEVIKPGSLYEIGGCFVGIDDGHQWALVKYVGAELKKQK